MRTTLSLSFTCIFLTALISFNLYGSEKIFGKVLFARGKIYILRDKIIISVTQGVSINSNDVVKTKENSLVIIGFGSKLQSKMRIDSDTKIRIKRIRSVKSKKSTVATKLFQYLGSILIDIKAEDRGIVDLEVLSRSASMGVRGTRFFVYVKKEDPTQVTTSVKEGKILVTSNINRKRRLKLLDGESTMITKDGDIRRPSFYKWQDKINWNLDTQMGSVAQGVELFTEIDMQYEQWKGELEKKRKMWNKDMKKKLDDLKNSTDEQFERMFNF